MTHGQHEFTEQRETIVWWHADGHAPQVHARFATREEAEVWLRQVTDECGNISTDPADGYLYIVDADGHVPTATD